jgi:hypothetical protein
VWLSVLMTHVDCWAVDLWAPIGQWEVRCVSWSQPCPTSCPEPLDTGDNCDRYTCPAASRCMAQVQVGSSQKSKLAHEIRCTNRLLKSAAQCRLG